MNPKMFALLLLLPVAVFATEKITSTDNDGGGKEKRKPETTQNPTGAASTESPAEVDAIQEPVAQLKPGIQTEGHRLDTKSSVEELKTMMEEAQEIFYTDGESHYHIRGEEVGASLRTWLEHHVEDPLKEVNPIGINLERSFSRCPSGYHVVVAGNDGELSNEGWMVVDDGCWDRPVARFRYDVAANKVEANAGKTLGFIPLNDFLKLCKAANS